MFHKTNSDKHKSYEGLLGPQFFSCQEAHSPSLRISGLGTCFNRVSGPEWGKSWIWLWIREGFETWADDLVWGFRSRGLRKVCRQKYENMESWPLSSPRPPAPSWDVVWQVLCVGASSVGEPTPAWRGIRGPEAASLLRGSCSHSLTWGWALSEDLKDPRAPIGNEQDCFFDFQETNFTLLVEFWANDKAHAGGRLLSSLVIFLLGTVGMGLGEWFLTILLLNRSGLTTVHCFSLAGERACASDWGRYSSVSWDCTWPFRFSSNYVLGYRPNWFSWISVSAVCPFSF